MTTADRILALYRTQFAAFVRFAYRELHPNTPLVDTWHIDVVAEHLERVAKGEITRLVINLPPRNLKSLAASIALPVWMLGRNPHLKIMAVAGSQELARDFETATCELMTAQRCRAVFPQLAFKRRRGEIRMDHGGLRISGIVGRTLVGRGADLIIIDDPIAPAYVDDNARRNAVNTWFDAEVIQRLNDKAKGAVIVVMQRLHDDDLCGHLLRGERRWTHLSLPAIAVGPENWQLRTDVVHTRQMGDVLAPAIDNHAALLARMLDIGAYNFAAQYQQAPFKRKEPDEMRGGCFAGPDDPSGLPGMWLGRVSERKIMAYELFGIGERHPAERRRRVTIEEFERVLENERAKKPVDDPNENL
jgi:hypothetical protein